jgi:hypothetical protein
MDDTLRVDTSFASQLDQRFVLILFASIATHVIIATWLAHQPSPVEVELAQPVDRFAPLRPIPKLTPPPVASRAALLSCPARPLPPHRAGRASQACSAW